MAVPQNYHADEAQETNDGLHEGTKDSREILISLARFAAVINAERDPEKVLELICREVHTLYRTELAVLWEREGSELVAVKARGVIAPQIQGLRVPIDSDVLLACSCLRSRTTLLKTEVPEIIFGPPPGLRLDPAAVVLCVPLIHQEEVLGVISLREREKADRFTPEDLEIISIFAGMAAVAMANAHLSKEMEKRAREATVLNEIGRIASSGMDVREKSEAFALKLRDLVPFDRMTLAIVEGGDKFKRVLVAGDAVDRYEPGSTSELSGHGLEWLIKHQRTLVVPDLERTQAFSSDHFFLKNGLRSSIKVPLMESGNVFGSLSLWSRNKGTYGPREVELLEQVANQIAGVFAHAQMVDTQRNILNRLYSLHRITDAALSTLDLDSLLEVLLDRCIEIVEADGGTILLLDESEQALSARGARWREGKPPWVYPHKLGDGISSHVAKNGKPRLIRDVELESQVNVAISKSIGVRSILAVPLRARDRTLGVLRLDSRQPCRFDSQHLQMMEVAAERMALAIDNARLLQEAQERANYEALIHRIASSISASLDLEKVIDTAVRELREATNASRCTVVLTDPKGELVWRRWEARDENIEPAQSSNPTWKDDPIIRAVMSSPRPIAIEDVWNAPLPAPIIELARRTNVRSVLAVPLLHGSKEPIGGIKLFQYGSTRRWTKRKEELIQAVATQLALAVENARLYSQTDKKLRARVRELGSLLRLGRAVSEQLSPDLVMRRATEEGVRALDADYCSIFTLNPATRTLVIEEAFDRDGGFGVGVGTKLSIEASDDPFETYLNRDPRRISDGDKATSAAERGLLLRLGMAKAIMLSLRTREKPIGVAFFGRKADRPDFSEDDLALARAVVGQFAVALENALLFQEVQKQKSSTEALLSSMSEGVYAIDMDRRITSVNPWLESMIGQRAQDILMRTCHEVLCHTDEEGVPLCDRACPLAEVLNKGKPSDPMMVFTRTAWGDMLPTVVSFAPIRNALGETIGAVSVSRDVTREWQMDKFKSNIISIVSHEFRTPLTSIMGFSEFLLTHERPKKERRRCLELIHQESLRLETLVNDLLDVSRLDAGKISLDLQPLDPKQVVERAITLMAVRSNEHRLISEIDGSLPAVEADPERLQQILGNLLSNAIKYSHKGTPIVLRARATSTDISGASRAEAENGERWVIFTVEDKGIGISPDQLPNIFVPFHRIEGDLTRRIRGTGLGLSIVKSLVELHGGKLWVESEVGIGSKFHVALKAVGRTQPPEQ